jgi:hypothetical protein
MGYGEGQRVRGVRRRSFRKPENHPNHLSDLRLFGAPVTGDGSLHEGWRVLVDFQPGARTNEECDAAGMPQLGRGLGVFREEKGLDAGLGRSVDLEDLDQCLFDVDEPDRDGGPLICVNDPVGDVKEARTSAFDDSPAEMAGARIEPEHDGH